MLGLKNYRMTLWVNKYTQKDDFCIHTSTIAASSSHANYTHTKVRDTKQIGQVRRKKEPSESLMPLEMKRN